MANKPSIPKGTRDFSPTEMLRRKYIFSTIEKVFQKYGFLPLETPAMENLETLTGKYGEEGDRLIFKILNSGDAWDGVNATVKEKLKAGEAVHPGRFASEVSEKALRYDLTVPFARYVVQHQNEITFPFKRYQIQPVWRADRPQKGRYREFYQCDADVIGSKSLINEVELVQLFDDVFAQLGLTTIIKLNSRKVLAGIAEVMGQPEKLVDFTIVLDKLEKVGRQKVVEEALERGIMDESMAKLDALFSFIENPILNGSWDKKIGFMRQYLKQSPIGQEGLNEVEFVFSNSADRLSIMTTLDFDWTLARGLDYYTGAIFEVVSSDGSMRSSICGGGRYDDLTGIFGLKNMSGVGISFGADRIYDVLLERYNAGDKAAFGERSNGTQLLFATAIDEKLQWAEVARYCLKPLWAVREAGIFAELYPDEAKLLKQFTYAEKKGIPFVAIVGETEMKEGKVTFRKMGPREKGDLITIEELIQRLKQ